ncbi:cupin domain-containing protein [Streptomyces hoynatensis]|uniref:Cupin domain-containing protein n=1 Tax=Streptomyces hoynatensis TaxID=1141874 RepID=A0A3A9Z6G9_9ACTN|nr:cupin domain-containing protein [Streptomyces hoynatensis]RKN43961.1 cupin domain-containing protein [Streptomyces hoynatensis]
MRNVRRAAVTGAAVLGLSLFAGNAEATPGSGVEAVTLAGTTVDGRDYVLREITVQPGGGTGWHFHDGTLYAYVRQGNLSHFDASCASDGEYAAGATFVEPSGADHVHIGRNLGDRPLVLDVLYVLPAGSPLSEDAPNPGCPFE